MSDEGTFLARWSRRKRDASPNMREQPAADDAADGTSPGPSPVVSVPDEIQPPFDLASLQSIETIGAGSDIRPFLTAGVPADLTRAALRRVWSSDPAIRDFTGLSENSWDFNAPGAMSGFGPIDKEEVGRLLTRLLGPEATAVATDGTTELSQPDKVQGREGESGLAEKTQITPESRASIPATDYRPQQLDTDDATKYRKVTVASQHEIISGEHSPTITQRSHGSALPSFHEESAEQRARTKRILK